MSYKSHHFESFMISLVIEKITLFNAAKIWATSIVKSLDKIQTNRMAVTFKLFRRDELRSNLWSH